MTSAAIDDDGNVTIRFTKSEALVLFEWLSRNWEASQWDHGDLFVDPAEQQLLMWIECDLERVLAEPFDPNYAAIVEAAHRAILPDPNELG